MKFNVGDLVRQIDNVSEWENPLAVVVRIDGSHLYHVHKGRPKSYITSSNIEDFEFVSSQGIDLSHIKPYGIVKFLESIK